MTKNLFEQLAHDEEEYIDFFETQQEFIRQMGIQLYCQKHIGELEKD